MEVPQVNLGLHTSFFFYVKLAVVRVITSLGGRPNIGANSSITIKAQRGVKANDSPASRFILVAMLHVNDILTTFETIGIFRLRAVLLAWEGLRLYEANFTDRCCISLPGTLPDFCYVSYRLLVVALPSPIEYRVYRFYLPIYPRLCTKTKQLRLRSSWHYMEGM